MGKPSWFYVLISLNENLAKLCVAANNGRCIKLKNNNEKVIFFCSPLITEAVVEGPKCTGHMAHLTTPDGAAGPASPRSTLAALTPSLGPHPFSSAFQLLCCCMLVFLNSFPCFSVSANVFSSRGVSQLLPHSGPRLVSVCPLKEINIHTGWHLGLCKGLLMISRLQIS